VSSDCLFCKILARQIPAKIVHEDAEVFAFEDINPQSPTHVLVCPKKHFASLDHASAGEEASYRAVINTGSEAGQSVFHLHLHLLGGRTFAWPPG